MFNKELRQTRKSLKGIRKQLRSRARNWPRPPGWLPHMRQAKKANKQVQKALRRLR